MPDQSVEAFAARLASVLARAAADLPPQGRTALAALVTPENLAIAAGELSAWLLGFGFVIGGLVDIVIAETGVFPVGIAVFSGLDALFAFARQSHDAHTEKDINVAADHLARSIAILGLPSVLAIVFRGHAEDNSFPVTTAEPRFAGLAQQPRTVLTASLAAGGGVVSSRGDIELATLGAPTDRNVGAFHEQVHGLITPRFAKLRRFQVEQKLGAYFDSSFYLYLDNALADTLARVGVNGFSKLFAGIRFPVENMFVYLMRGGGYSATMTGKGLLPQSASLIASGTLQGFGYRIFLKAGAPTGFAKPVVPGAPKSAGLPPPTTAVLKGAFSRATETARR